MSGSIKFASCFISLVFVILLTACGGGEDGVEADKYSITLNKSSMSFESTYKAGHSEAQTVDVNFDGDGVVVGTPPNANLPNWLNVRTVSSSSNSATFEISIDPAIGWMSLFTSSTSIRFVTGNADGTGVVFKDLVVSLTVGDAIYFENQLRSGTGISGTAPFSIGVIDIDTIQESWSVSDMPEWVTVSAESGSGAMQLEVFANPVLMAAGTYEGNITITNSADIHNATVSAIISKQRIYSSDLGFAFIDTPTKQILEKTFSFSTNSGSAVEDWNLIEKPAWIQVDTSAQLRLSYSEQDLEAGLHCGVVKVTNKSVYLDNNIEISGCIYIQSNIEIIEGVVASISGNFNGGSNNVFAMGTTRPYFYLLDKQTNLISAHNIYSGDVAFTLPPVTSIPSAMVVSDDGTELYAKLSDGLDIYKLESKSKTTVQNLGFSFSNPSKIHFARILGIPHVYTKGMTLLNLDTLKATTSGFGLNPAPVISKNGSQLFLIDNYGSGDDQIIRLDIEYNETLDEISLENYMTLFSSIDYRARSLVLNNDNSEIAILEPIAYENRVSIYNSDYQLLKQFDVDNYPYEMIVTNDKVIVLSDHPVEGAMSVYDKNGSLLKKEVFWDDYEPDDGATLLLSPYGDRVVFSVIDDYLGEDGLIYIYDL